MRRELHCYVIIVQRITTLWTKSSRNAIDRQARAELPKAYELPDSLLLQRSGCAIHCVHRSAHSGYREQQQWDVSATASSGLGSVSGQSVRLNEVDEGLRLTFEWNDRDCGIPQRRGPDPYVVEKGQRVRVRFNGRFIGWEGSWYEDKILNIAYGCVPSRSMFTASEIATAFESLVDLW